MVNSGPNHFDPSPIGRWVVFDNATATPAIAKAIDEFQPLDNPGGRAAYRWLKDEALPQDGATRTHLLLDEDDGRLLGYFACCADRISLTRKSILTLGLRTSRTTMPAFLLCWIARDRGEDVALHLMATAFGLAQEAAKSIGIVAFALDPKDDAVAEVWMQEPYYFQESSTRRKSGPPRLWLPV